MSRFFVDRIMRLTFAVLIPGTFSFVFSQAQIPVLNWAERSDWVNVKTDVTPAAVGNGIADDTRALQAALDQVGWSPTVPTATDPGKVCYLPPGTYRITKTLLLNDRLNGLVVGHGRSTIIRWDGQAATGNWATEIPMFWSKGAVSTGYYGITWDGNNKAGLGFDHAARGDSIQFECQIRHENCAFINIKGGGLRFMMGQAMGGLATSETQVRNCLFENCDQGAGVNYSDYLNITFEGCEFRNCREGIFNCGGRCHVRDCHFENNTGCDINGAPSAIRCTSTGSRMFFSQNRNYDHAWIQDCHVSNWTKTDGAVLLYTMTMTGYQSDCSPDLVFDNVFTNPPSTYPPIRVDSLGIFQLVHSNNTSVGTDSVFINAASNKSRTHFVPIPYTPGVNRCPTNLTATQSFLKSTLPAMGTVFDAKRDFAGNIQNTINAAAAAGNGAIAYIPCGEYRISQTINITGSNYTIQGAGANSGIYWSQTATNDTNRIMFLVQNTHNIKIENLGINNFGGSPVYKGTRIFQAGSTAGSSITYDRIWMNGYTGSKALVLNSLTELDTVHIIRLNCSGMPTQYCPFVVKNSSRATIYTDFLDGPILIYGNKYPKTGFLGVQYMNQNQGTPGTIAILNNQNAIFCNYYTEGGEAPILPKVYLRGGETGDPTEGRVTIGTTKFGGYTDTLVRIDNYAGRLAITWGSPEPQRGYWQFGAQACSLTFLATSFNNDPTNLFHGTNFTAYKVGCRTLSGGGPTVPDGNVYSVPVLQECARILDDFRLLGQKDLWINYGLNLNPGCHDSVAVLHPAINAAITGPQIRIAGQTIHLPDAQKYSIELFDARGALVNRISAQGPGTVVLPVHKTGGIYMIKVLGEMQSLVRKMIVM